MVSAIMLPVFSLEELFGSSDLCEFLLNFLISLTNIGNKTYWNIPLWGKHEA